MRAVIVMKDIGHYHDARFSALAKATNELHIISTSSCSYFSEFATQRKHTKEYRIIDVFPTSELYAEAVRRGRMRQVLGRTLDRVSPDVVAVSGWAQPESIAAIQWARARQVGIVVMSESQERDGPRNFWREFVKTRVLRHCDAALVGGTEHTNYLVKLGFRREFVFRGYDAVDNGHFRNGSDDARKSCESLRRSFGLPSCYALASGRFVPKKNIDGLIEGFASYAASERAPHHLVLLGDGPERGLIERRVQEFGIRHLVHFAGFRSYTDLTVFYGLASAFVHYSKTEQWGLVVNEAMASGLPVIVSKNCGAAEMIRDGVNGVIVDPEDPRDLSRALRRVLSLAPGMRNKWGKKSREAVAPYDVDKFADGFFSAAACAISLVKNRRLDRNSLLDILIIGVLSRIDSRTVA